MRSAANDYAMGFGAKRLASPVNQVGPVERRMAGGGVCLRDRDLSHGPRRANSDIMGGRREYAFRDWFPWIVLSPAAVFLASRFRFERDHWRRNLLIHVAAVFLFAIAYQGLEMLFLPGPFILSTGTGVVSVGEGPALGVTGFRAYGEVPPAPFPSASNQVFDRVLAINGTIISGNPPRHSPLDTLSTTFPPRSPLDTEQPGQLEHARSLPSPVHSPFDLAPASNGVFGVQTVRVPGAPLQTVEFGGNFLTFPTPSWPPLLHMMLARTRLTFPIYLCIVCVCWLFNHYQEANERQRRTLELESRLTQANLQALKMQLQPHFLFNTLNTISSLIHDSPALADDMVGSLSQFLLNTLDC